MLEADGEVAGFCLVRVRGEGWSIAEFSVVPEKRRSGIGRSAVEALAERAHAAGAEHLEAKVYPGKPEALAFWLALGAFVWSRRLA